MEIPAVEITFAMGVISLRTPSECALMVVRLRKLWEIGATTQMNTPYMKLLKDRPNAKYNN